MQSGDNDIRRSIVAGNWRTREKDMKIGMTHFYWKSYSDVELESWVVFHTI